MTDGFQLLPPNDVDSGWTWGQLEGYANELYARAKLAEERLDALAPFLALSWDDRQMAAVACDLFADEEALLETIPHESPEAVAAALNRVSAALACPPQRVTHGRHCPCTACEREDWTRITAPCGMHGPDCPAVYAPLAACPPPEEEK